MTDESDVRLGEALARGDLQAAREALDAGADIEAVDANRYTPLHRAIWFAPREGSELIELLLSRGADPTASAGPGHANPFEFAVYNRKLPVARRLLEAGASVTPRSLQDASREPEMLALLEEWPIRRSSARELDKRLMLAARAGDLEAVTTLLREGADVTASDAAGVAAFDHAAARRHFGVMLALERAEAERDADAALFLATLDGSISGVLNAAKPTNLESRNRRGMTALMLAARYRRHCALSTLLSLHPQVDARNGAATALVYAIDAGDLVGARLLLERGATIDVDVDGRNPVLDAACRQTDSELLKQLLVRGIDIQRYPRQGAADDESNRMLRKARDGVLPVAGPPSFLPWSRCAACRDLPDTMGWSTTSSGEHTGEPLPDITEQFETFWGLWKCPWCGTFYDHERYHDNGIYYNNDSESLRRIPLERARQILRAKAPTPRIERELRALDEVIAFEEALARPGRKVQVRGTEARDGAIALVLYSLADDRAKQLAVRRVRVRELDLLVADLQARGCAVAETDFRCGFVWVRGADGIAVHDDTGKVFEAAGERATLEEGRLVERGDIARVIAFAEGYEHRGVKAVLRSGEEVVLLTDPGSATIDPFYTRNELLYETGWCTTLGRATAAWAGVGFENQI